MTWLYHGSHPVSYSLGSWGLFPVDRAVGEWNWPPPSGDGIERVWKLMFVSPWTHMVCCSGPCPAVPILHVPFVLINKTVFRWNKVYLYSVVFWHHSPLWTLASSFRSFSAEHIFMGWGCQPHNHPPTPGYTSLSGMGHPACYYTDVSIAVRIIWPFEPHHFIKVGFPLGLGGGGVTIFTVILKQGFSFIFIHKKVRTKETKFSNLCTNRQVVLTGCCIIIKCKYHCKAIVIGHSLLTLPY